MVSRSATIAGKLDKLIDSAAAAPETGGRLYHHFSDRLRAMGISVANGEFGADMDVELVNQGPVTIWLDTAG